MVLMKFFVLLLMMHVENTVAARWTDFERLTCLSEGWSLPATWHGKPHAEFIWEGTEKIRVYQGAWNTGITKGLTRDGCKKKCEEYNMNNPLWAKIYPCRAIEWMKKSYRTEEGPRGHLIIYKTICRLSFRVEHISVVQSASTYYRDWATRTNRCIEGDGWYFFSLMNTGDIKGSGWTSDSTLKSVNYEGHDLYESCEKVDSYQACREKCQKDIKCGFWTWVVDDPWWADKRLSGGCCLKDYEAAWSIRDQPSNCQGVCLYSGPKNIGM